MSETEEMSTNEKILKELFDKHKQDQKSAYVTKDQLQKEGYEGLFPALSYTKNKEYWVREVLGQAGRYQIIKVPEKNKEVPSMPTPKYKIQLDENNKPLPGQEAIIEELFPKKLVKKTLEGAPELVQRKAE